MRQFPRTTAFALALLLGLLGATTPAQAWWNRGYGHGYYGGGYGPGYYGRGYYGRGYYGPGIVLGVPLVVGPPVVYGPPPVYYAPPVAAGEGCYAGAYVCPLDRPTIAGAQCSCPVNGNTRVFGTAR